LGRIRIRIRKGGENYGRISSSLWHRRKGSHRTLNRFQMPFS